MSDPRPDYVYWDSRQLEENVQTILNTLELMQLKLNEIEENTRPGGPFRLWKVFTSPPHQFESVLNSLTRDGWIFECILPDERNADRLTQLLVWQPVEKKFDKPAGSLLPMQLVDADGQVIEELICESISGGLDQVLGMPARLTLMRLQKGRLVGRAEYYYARNSLGQEGDKTHG